MPTCASYCTRWWPRPVPVALLVSIQGLLSLLPVQGAIRGIDMQGEFNLHPESYSSQEACGIQKKFFEPPEFNGRTPRIRNGTCAPYGSLPWNAQIQIRNGDDFDHHCGGSIISDLHVITARHCFGQSDLRAMRVVVGQNNIYELEDKEMSFEISDVFFHSQYQESGPFSNDIALIRLRPKGDGKGIRFSEYVRPICLPEKSSKFEDDHKCIISGWGKMKPFGEIHPECLRGATIPLMNRETCSSMYTGSRQKIIESMICAGYTTGGVDACKGDSGGPLACYSEGTYKLVGIVSWGQGCGKAESPGVFTRVQHYLDWIDEKIKETENV